MPAFESEVSFPRSQSRVHQLGRGSRVQFPHFQARRWWSTASTSPFCVVLALKGKNCKKFCAESSSNSTRFAPASEFQLQLLTASSSYAPDATKCPTDSWFPYPYQHYANYSLLSQSNLRRLRRTYSEVLIAVANFVVGSFFRKQSPPEATADATNTGLVS